MKEIIICGIGLLGALITYFLVPLLKDKTELTQRQLVVERMKTAFMWAKEAGITPARAGRTIPMKNALERGEDHPRSRGKDPFYVRFMVT